MSTTRDSGHRARTRVLRRPQTHDGCFTCKARKIRCDLKQPFCERCTKANKACCGYRDTVPCEDSFYPSPVSDQHVTRILPLDLEHQSPEIAHLVKLGCKVLHQGAIWQAGLASSFWSSMLPQLGYLDTLVGASMAALGAAIKSYLMPSPSGEVLYSRHCASALRSIQQAVESSVQSSVSLIAACLLLAISEILMDQELSALSHLQGMLMVLRQRQRSKINLLSLELHPHRKEHFNLNDEIDAAGAILDIGTSSYALGLEPRLPILATKVQSPGSSLNNDLSTIEQHVLKTLHSSYAFASGHFHWRYVPHNLVPKDAFIDQNHVCAELFQRIQAIGALLPSLHTAQISRAHILRAQCSACLIYCQNLLESREVGYDRFWSSFSAIVEDAEVVLQEQLSREKSYLSFSLDLGVIQPLFFTGVKCRNLQTRTEAVDLLRKSSREGPFDGRRLAVVAQRAVDLETGILNGNDSQCRGSEVVPEKHRLHSAGIDNTGLPGILCKGVPAWFSRCRDIEALLEAESPDDYKEPKHWEMWDELLPWAAELEFATSE